MHTSHVQWPLGIVETARARIDECANLHAVSLPAVVKLCARGLNGICSVASNRNQEIGANMPLACDDTARIRRLRPSIRRGKPRVSSQFIDGFELRTGFLVLPGFGFAPADALDGLALDGGAVTRNAG